MNDEDELSDDVKKIFREGYDNYYDLGRYYLSIGDTADFWDCFKTCVNAGQGYVSEKKIVGLGLEMLKQIHVPKKGKQ